jgi:methyl-accepting chemotaxis protein
MSETRPQRRIYYVSPRIQGKLIARMAAYWCVYHVVLWHAMFLFHYLQNPDGILSGGPQVRFFELYCGYAVENSTMLLCAALVFPLILWDMIYLTHRVAGPLVRFQNTLRRMSEGEEIKQIQLRDGDLLDDLRDAFNDYLDSLQERKHGRAASATATASVAEPVAISTSPASEVRESLQRLPLMERGHRVASQQNLRDEEFDSILHDLRDIQSTVGGVQADNRSANVSSVGIEDARID